MQLFSGECDSYICNVVDCSASLGSRCWKKFVWCHRGLPRNSADRNRAVFVFVYFCICACVLVYYQDRPTWIGACTCVFVYLCLSTCVLDNLFVTLCLALKKYASVTLSGFQFSHTLSSFHASPTQTGFWNFSSCRFKTTLIFLVYYCKHNIRVFKHFQVA